MSTRKKRSLAEEIALLSTPAPASFHPDEEELADPTSAKVGLHSQPLRATFTCRFHAEPLVYHFVCELQSDGKADVANGCPSLAPDSAVALAPAFALGTSPGLV